MSRLQFDGPLHHGQILRSSLRSAQHSGKRELQVNLWRASARPESLLTMVSKNVAGARTDSQQNISKLVRKVIARIGLGQIPQAEYQIEGIPRAGMRRRRAAQCCGRQYRRGEDQGGGNADRLSRKIAGGVADRCSPGWRCVARCARRKSRADDGVVFGSPQSVNGVKRCKSAPTGGSSASQGLPGCPRQCHRRVQQL